MTTMPVKKMNVFQSKWGFHPCDYETFVKLKKLHKTYWEAVRGVANWFRWNAKQPQNRVLTRRIKDETGKVVDKEILGPWNEPQYCTLFGQPDRKWRDETIPQHLDDHGIIEAYHKARMPVEANCVQPLKLTIEKIDELFNQLK